MAGLGNPGPRYRGTRHNVGFRLIRRLVGRHGLGHSRKTHRSKVWSGEVSGHPTLLMQPQTYMNLSGQAIRLGLAHQEAEPAQSLVVCDDFNLPLGRLRLRRGGRAGGHKGLQSIIDVLDTEEFPRLRLGIGEPGEADTETFVLEKFLPDEEEAVLEAIDRAADAVETWIRMGIEDAMSRFNG